MEDNLKKLIKLFYKDNQQLDQYKKSTEEYNKEIKEDMQQLGISEFEADDLIAKILTQKRESFDEDKLLIRLKELNITAPIKTKEYIDMDELENQIYNGFINASELSNTRIVKEIITLKVNIKK